jgi:hypothetical protein
VSVVKRDAEASVGQDLVDQSLLGEEFFFRHNAISPFMLRYLSAARSEPRNRARKREREEKDANAVAKFRRRRR